jgi:hypothetical protein
MTTRALRRSVLELASRIPRPRTEPSRLSLRDIRRLKDHVCALAIAERAAGRLNNLQSWQQEWLDSYKDPPRRLRKSELVRLLTPRTCEALGLSRARTNKRQSSFTVEATCRISRTDRILRSQEPRSVTRPTSMHHVRETVVQRLERDARQPGKTGQRQRPDRRRRTAPG